ncbi:MAG: response regulator [Nocardioides sp.]|uniref:response regulator n=1 Tax=Nocardioides sp. TaxID=35761 RepID=UPI003D6B5447
MSVRVLVVEDEELAAEAHAAYVDRVSGFVLAGIARSARDAGRALDLARETGAPVDLVLLDMNLPDGHGLGLLGGLRAAGHLCDVIAVTAARDTRVVRQAVGQGVVLYLLKPFTFATFRDKLEQYADYRARLDAAPEEVVQHEVDQLLGSLRPSGSAPLPKGMSPETLQAVTAALRGADHDLSASEVAAVVGASRVTARRYLEHLADTGLAARGVRYGPSGGRPEVSYSWG